MPHPSTPALVRELMLYMLVYPNASDTAEGMARWWFDPRQRVDMTAVQEALDWLVRQEVFAERVAIDGRRSYRRICSDLRLQQLIAQASP